MTDYETIAISKKQYLDTEHEPSVKETAAIGKETIMKKYGKVKYTTTTYNDR